MTAAVTAQTRDLEIEGRMAKVETRQSEHKEQIDRHERNDAERWNALDKQVTRVHERIDRMGYAAWGAALSAILTLIAVLAQMAVHIKG